MSISRKAIKRENREKSYIDLLQRTIDSAEDDMDEDPLSEQINEEESILDDFESPHRRRERRSSSRKFNASVSNFCEISAEARRAERCANDSDDEIWIRVKRKRSEPGGSRDESGGNVSNGEIYNLLLSMDKRLTRVEKLQEKMTKALGSVGTSSSSKMSSSGSIMEMRNPVVKYLPMKTVMDVEEFDQMLNDPDFEASFRSYIQTAELKHLMEDSLVIHYNYNGIQGKMALKDYNFIQIWKEVVSASVDDFENVIKSQVRAAKSRQYTAKCLMKKKHKEDDKD